VLVVDECRASGGGPSARILAELAERTEGVRMRRITAVDTFIPLGDAANAVLVQEHDIVAAALELCGGAKP
jgi:2-oxoisovalerate dehydrogenase E1 component